MSISSAASEGSRQLAATLTLLPESERCLLKRCALLSSFDEGIISELNRDIGTKDGAVLADLAEYPFIYAVRDRPGRYRIREDMRKALVESWWDGQPPDASPPELAEVSARLAEQIDGTPGADPAEVVGLRLFADLENALEQWKKLYTEADQQFDFVRCRALISMLSLTATVKPEVDAVREHYGTYVEARSLWTDEWFRTGSFLLPAVSREALESLIRGDHGRMLELQGFAGYGKTMHVRWLIARRCVPADSSIPCARIDFDAVDPLAATRDPYLVLLEMADQLDRQLRGDAFGKLVRTYSADRVRLYRRTRAAMALRREVRDPAQEEVRLAAANEVQRRFGGRLAEIPADRPVVLILDTLEVPLHLPDTSRGPAIQPLLTALATVQWQAPCVRLILSGRYEISQGLRNLFPDRCDRFELPKFTEEEARAYLVGKRHIQRGDLVEAALQASECVPFSLALLADLIDTDPAISPATIADYRGAEYAYLIEKVVKRIQEQPVRWVLRYAAIPRRFDYDFVRDVLWRRVCGEMGGIGGLDHPAGDDLPQGTDGKGLWEVGETPPAEEEAVQQVWDQVKRYAGGSSWIGPDDKDVDALRLQTEVIRPLRELLRRQKIFAVLHADAARYFLRRAAEEDDDGTPGQVSGDRRGEFLREAVFHRFQAEGQAAGHWWEEQIRRARDPATRLALADELARQPGYTDQDGRPVPWGDGTLVSEETLQRARLELCLTCAELATLQATLRPRHALWQDASDALERLECFSTDALPSGRVALARAAVALGTRQPGDIAGDLRRAMEDPGPSPRERLWVAVLDAYRHIAVGSPDADARLETAWRLEQEAMEERDVRELLAFGVVQRLEERGAIDEAIAACRAAVDARLGDTDFHLAEAAMRLSVGDAETARSVAKGIASDGSALALLAEILEARCSRRQHRFGAATATARRVLAALDEAQDVSPFAVWVRARALFESGESAAALLHVREARTAYADASRLFGEADDFEETASCHLQEAALLMNGLDHLRATGVTLDYADRAAPPGGDVALYAQLTRAELADRLGDRAGAAIIVQRAGSDDPRAALPRWMAAIAVAGLAVGERRDRDRYTTQLAKGLQQISPPTARLQLLTRIIRCPQLEPQSKAVMALREAVVPAGGWEQEFARLAVPDRATLRLRAAAFARMLGDHDDADEMLGAALQEYPAGKARLTWLREALQLARLLRSADSVAHAGQQGVAIAVNHAEEHPLLAAVTVIEYLEAVMELGVPPGEDPAALCRQAEAWLDRAGLSAEAWRAKLADLNATIGNADSATVSSYLQAAVRLYDAVGDMQAAEEVQNRVPSGRTRPGSERPKIVVDVWLTQDAIKSKVAGQRTRLLPRLRKEVSGRLRDTKEVSGRLRDTIVQWVRAAGPEPYPPDIPDLMVSQWLDFKRALAEVLDAEAATRWRPGPERPDLEVRVYDGVLQSLPWELAAHPKEDRPFFAGFRRAYRPSVHAARDTRMIRVVQAGLNVLGYPLDVDGVSGPNTDKALQDSGTPPGRADDPETVQRLHQALFRGARQSVILTRGASAESQLRSLALERRYAQAGFETLTVSPAHLPELLVLRGEPPPVIVHIVGGVVATAGMTAVDLQDDGSGWGPLDEAGLLTTAKLDQALRAVPQNWPTPIIVLDIPAPTGHREAGDQLLLRNGFAADLFAMGSTRAVVGTGLADRTATDLIQDVLIEGLAHGDAIGDVVQRMRRQAEPACFTRFESSVAFTATALWSNDPSMRLPPLGGS